MIFSAYVVFMEENLPKRMYARITGQLAWDPDECTMSKTTIRAFCMLVELDYPWPRLQL